MLTWRTRWKANRGPLFLRLAFVGEMIFCNCTVKLRWFFCPLINKDSTFDALWVMTCLRCWLGWMPCGEHFTGKGDTSAAEMMSCVRFRTHLKQTNKQTNNDALLWLTGLAFCTLHCLKHKSDSDTFFSAELWLWGHRIYYFLLKYHSLKSMETDR